VHRFAPFPTGEPAAYALVGMGALFAGIIRAPMTSVFMIFEITQDYQILVPLMVANMLSYAISRRYQHEAIYDELLHQDGVHLPPAYLEPSSAAGWTARDLMTSTATFLPGETPIKKARDDANAERWRARLVGSHENVLGVVTAKSLEDAMRGGCANEPVSSLMPESFAHVHPDHSADMVLRRLAESGGVLPVVSRAASHQCEGVITADVVLKLIEGSSAVSPS
jgi:CIC family chloride channel protein